MTEYKLGNKINCIIRGYVSGQLGQETLEYDKQPYTILKDVEANLTWGENDRTANTNRAIWQYHNNSASTLRLTNVPLTNKFLNLIFPKSQGLLCSSFKNYVSNDKGEVYLITSSDMLYEVFVYDDEGKLEEAFDSLDTNKLTLKKPNSSYLVVYSFVGAKSLSLDMNPDTSYLTLDLELIGNKDDQTGNSWMHLERCCLLPTKTLSFNYNLNSVDLEFSILSMNNADDNNCYLILE